MLKLRDTFCPMTALTLAMFLWCSTRGEGSILAPDRRGPAVVPASLEALSTGQLIAALGIGEPSEGVQICLEVARRFGEASPADRPNFLSRLAAVLESDPQPAARFGAIACLTGLVSAPADPGSQAVIAEILQNVLGAERDPTILAAAVRLLPDVDRSQSALSLLAELLDDSKLLQQHPELAREALLSGGRMGPQAIPLLLRFLPTSPETALIALSATDSEEAVDVLVEEAGGPDPERRYHAAHALGLCMGSGTLSAESRARVIRTLERAAQAESDPNIRQKALEWLKGAQIDP